jgi:DNA polymerase
LIVPDLKAIELHILAFITRDPNLMDALKNKEDVYCKFASKIYGREITKEKNKKERAVGKEAVLGLGYGMGSDRFIDTVYSKLGVRIEKKFAKDVVKLYRNTYTSVPKFWNTCEKVLEQLATTPRYFPSVSFLKLEKNAITLPSGLKLNYRNLRYTWKKMYNRWKKEWVYDRYKTKTTVMDKTKIYGGMLTENLCQGLAGGICKEGIKRSIEYGYPPVGQVHDELLFVCDKEEVEKVKYLVASAMTNPLPWWPELPLEVEIGTGQNWLECK